MKKEITIGAAQLGPIARSDSRKAVVERLIELMRRAKKSGCDVVVYPELALTSFFPRWYMENQEDVDSFFEHGDRSIRDGSIKKKIIIDYYSTLANFLKKLSKIYNKKVIICMHPKNNSKLFLTYLKDFSIKKYKTQEMVKKSFIALFHESSSILDAVILKKKIIILKSNLLGDYFSNRIKQYERLLNLQPVDIGDYHSLKKNKLNLILNSSKQSNYYIKNHLNADGLIPGYKKVIKLLKKI